MTARWQSRSTTTPWLVYAHMLCLPFWRRDAHISCKLQSSWPENKAARCTEESGVRSEKTAELAAWDYPRKYPHDKSTGRDDQNETITTHRRLLSKQKTTEEMSPTQQRSSSSLGSELQQVMVAYNGWTVETRSCGLPSPSVISWSDFTGQFFLHVSALLFFVFLILSQM